MCQEMEVSWLNRWRQITLTSCSEFPISLLRKAWNHGGKTRNLCWDPVKKQHTVLLAAWWRISITMTELQTRSDSKWKPQCLLLMSVSISSAVMWRFFGGNKPWALGGLTCYDSQSARTAWFQGRERHSAERVSAAVPPLGKRTGKGTLPLFLFLWLFHTEHNCVWHLRNTSQRAMGFSWQSHFQRTVVTLESVRDVNRTLMLPQVELSSLQKDPF